ncbi:PREDICTED: coiled-coil domain-containing protein 97 [Drosophila arizonae]|uniref:Coiled-coil domain-containing protein 97 n=1 Tax=Drosophila arizonae TaxID=7263 RepID=A0ABM1NY86_DROAR|nr:PREDICTED: coiled-coil domain-containing protein 97 [Drosophila arizonae]
MTQTETSNCEDCSEVVELPDQLMGIFKALAENANIIFKSQQIDDPELNLEEKQQIAQDAFQKSREHFLIRFGSYLTEQQLSDFQTVGVTEPIKPNENLQEICLLLDDFKRKLVSRGVCIKNRRYHAMQQLLQQGEYFSEHEMMQRAPELYQELVGQYLTEQEKKQRDSYDVRNTSFSGILMHTLEQKQREELLQQKVDINTEMHEPPTANVECEVPAACRQQWGGFEDDEPVACSSSRNTQSPLAPNNHIVTAEYYNPGERELLRNEFMGLMKERFLSGQDTDFDYTAVDDNAQLDDLKQIERDEEDAYFESSDGEDPVAAAAAAADDTVLDEGEDDLEVYMRHLNQHHSLQH